jgi:predicted dinucleotide-binding enzyme
MAKIAFLGLGQMGAPMAARLLQAGHELTVWNRTPDRAKPLAAGGATVAKSPAEAGAGAAFAITMVATPEALKDVVLSGEHSLVRALSPVRCTSTCRRLVRTPSDRSPPSSRWCRFVSLAVALSGAVSDADRGVTRVRCRLRGKCVLREVSTD